MADELSWHGILRGVLVLMLLWWAWTGYAWLANVASADERPIKLAILGGMAAMFVLALCIPEAFDDLPGGLSGPVVLAVCYLLFRLMHLVMFLIISRRPSPAVAGSSVRPQLPRKQRAAIAGIAVRWMAANRPLGSGAR